MSVPAVEDPSLPSDLALVYCRPLDLHPWARRWAVRLCENFIAATQSIRTKSLGALQ